MKKFYISLLLSVVLASVGYAQSDAEFSFEAPYYGWAWNSAGSYVSVPITYTGVYSADGVPAPDGGIGGCMTFNGSQYLRVVGSEDLLDASGSAALYIAFWVKTSSQKINNTIIDKRTSNSGYHVTLYDGRPLLNLNGPSIGWYNYWSSSLPKVNNGAWHYVEMLVIRNGPGSWMNVDWSHNPYMFDARKFQGVNLANSAPFRMGEHAFDSSCNFVGSLDEVEVVSW